MVQEKNKWLFTIVNKTTSSPNFKVIINLTTNMDNFTGEGDVNLFGEMLHRFFALYADVHLFNQLTLVLQPTGKRLRWRENHSQHVPG